MLVLDAYVYKIKLFVIQVQYTDIFTTVVIDHTFLLTIFHLHPNTF